MTFLVGLMNEDFLVITAIGRRWSMNVFALPMSAVHSVVRFFYLMPRLFNIN